MCCGARMPTGPVQPLAATTGWTGGGSGGTWEVTVPGQPEVQVVNSETEALTLVSNGGGYRRLS